MHRRLMHAFITHDVLDKYPHHIEQWKRRSVRWKPSHTHGNILVLHKCIKVVQYAHHLIHAITGSPRLGSSISKHYPKSPSDELFLSGTPMRETCCACYKWSSVEEDVVFLQFSNGSGVCESEEKRAPRAADTPRAAHRQSPRDPAILTCCNNSNIPEMLL